MDAEIAFLALKARREYTILARRFSGQCLLFVVNNLSVFMLVPFCALHFPTSCAALFAGKLLHFSAVCAVYILRALYFSGELCIFQHSNKRSNQVSM
jgi:hypothetical protein